MMKLATVTLAIVLGSPCLAEQPAKADGDAAAVQGIWRGTRPHYERFTLVFCGDSLYGIHDALGTQESTYRLNPGEGTIDIRREDGMQLGRYAVDDDTLTLILADVNFPRPKTLDDRGGNRSRFVFARQR